MMRIMPDAHHAFERDQPVFAVPEARVSPNAPIEYLDATGAMISARSGVADSLRTDAQQFQDGIDGGFGQKGAHMGGRPGLTELFIDDMLTFHRSVLTPSD